MTTKTKSRIAAAILTVLAVVYVVFALNNPQASLPFGTKVTGVLYGLYVGLVVILFIAPFQNKDDKK